MTSPKTVAAYGTWKSPIKAGDIASGTLRLGQVQVDEGNIYWLEGRPLEGGRVVLMRQSTDGSVQELLPEGYNARSLVHEYGGSSFLACGEYVFFTNYEDQKIYLLREGEEPLAITADGPWRYADMNFDFKRRRLYCVVEDHSPRRLEENGEPANYIASLDLDGLSGGGFKAVSPVVLTEGADFYAFPRVSSDGKHLVYISWNHPNMPWDGTLLTVAEFGSDGSLSLKEDIAGGEEESIFQPAWSPEGRLYFVSDRSGFWNIYRVDKLFDDALTGDIKAENLTPGSVEFGLPLWVFGMATYAFLNDGKIIAVGCDKGVSKLFFVDAAKPDLKQIEAEYTDIHYLCADGSKVAMLASSPASPQAVTSFDCESKKFTVVKPSAKLEIESGYISTPEIIEFPTGGSKTAYAFYYPPTNKDFEADSGSLPPLLVKSHGGPTGSTSTGLNLAFQYWTSRGFAVVDVNYGGSTGYGREYMKRLEKNWGVVDVEDCEQAALYLVKEGKADPKRLAITGGSAGGYTTLCVLTFKNTFAAGASHYGIGDLELLAKDTHKFESRYCDRLIGPYPQDEAIYKERSPIHFTDRLSCPLIVFQGLEDKVVPPNQAEAMVEAVKAKQLPVAYIAYEGEQHGFRKAENIERTIDAEFYFYAKIFGFKPADEIEPVEIINFDQSSVTAS